MDKIVLRRLRTLVLLGSINIFKMCIVRIFRFDNLAFGKVRIETDNGWMDG